MNEAPSFEHAPLAPIRGELDKDRPGPVRLRLAHTMHPVDLRDVDRGRNDITLFNVTSTPPPSSRLRRLPRSVCMYTCMPGEAHRVSARVLLQLVLLELDGVDHLLQGLDTGVLVGQPRTQRIM